MLKVGCLAAVAVAVSFWSGGALGQGGDTTVLTGADAFGDWLSDKPGVRRLITPKDLPKPYTSGPAANSPGLRARPRGGMPIVPDGFSVSLFADQLDTPRTIRVAPNGDVFVAESGANRVLVFRTSPPRADPTMSVFAGGFDYPYGIAFYPPGPNPQWVYVAQTDKVVRFPYRAGDVKARGPAQVIVPEMPTGGHFTRDIAFSPDGKRLYVAVGSGSNAAERSFPSEPPGGLDAWVKTHALGAAWSFETGRADILSFDPTGGDERVFATGIRNCAGLTVQPATGTLWCATNERDLLGDNLPPDYVTRVKEGAFYGWPWYYIGDNQDPNHAKQRPDLADKITVPDVLIQPHSAPLGITFYDGDAFPPQYRGDAFVTLHGSWNRGRRTGYKVVRIPMNDGVPTGEYEDFMLGFVISNGTVWGRPVGIAVDKDGALLVSEDGNGTIWRVTAKR